MELKVGDKVICIKSISKRYRNYTLGKQYIINYIYNGVDVFDGVDMLDDNDNDWGFDFEGGNFNEKFSKHFIALKQLRQLKLKELDEIKNR